jgi:hypothetical protein
MGLPPLPRRQILSLRLLFPASSRSKDAPMAFLRTLLASVTVALLLSACAGGGSDIPQCDDEIDNDGDGLVDSADPACQAGGTRESDDPPAQCGDGIDNDADGLTDDEDPGCEDDDDRDEYDGSGAACMDGVDNDGDGKTDYPEDPGCLAPNQNSGEADDCPSGPNCPECGNGDDDDLDGKIDFAGGDIGCMSASDRDEFEIDGAACGAGTTVSPLPTTGVVSGTITGAGNVTTTCGGSAMIGTGGEVAYIIRIDRPMTLVASVDYPGTNFDSVLYVRRACTMAASEVACSDDMGGTNRRSSLTASLGAGSYYLVVDSKTAVANAAFTLTASLYAGMGETCTGAQECAPGQVCRAVATATAMTCEQPVCSDGRDDDGDTKIDFPNDPGCTTPADTTETDPCPGAGCPACADGMDNDNDTRTDYPADPSCTSASGESEADCPTETDPLGVITAATHTGTTAGAGNQFAPSCASTSNAPDRVHMLYVRAPLATLVLDTNDSAFDTVLMLKTSTCGTTDVGCIDDGGSPSTRSRLALTNVAPGSYAVVVDGDFTGNGAYNLHVAGTYANGAACDPTMPMFTCSVGHACTGAAGAATCQPAACNDAVDADGDGLPGYPSDPGCTSISDGDESDSCFPTPGPGCPACANDVDDDMDGLTDYPADTGCASASGVNEQCITTDPVRNLTTATLTNQSTAALANDLDLSCGADGRDEIFRVRVDHPINELRVDTAGSALDTVLALRTPSCAVADLRCNDDTSTLASEVVQANPALGDYFIVVDDRNVSSPGTYNLRVRGNYANGGRCSPTNVFTCNLGYACTGAAGAETCNPAACNDTTDADGDGLPGYPADPGCTSASDGDESDTCFPTPGPGCPQCADDVDNDGDGFTDYPRDPACLSASVNDELAPCTSLDPILTFTSNVTGHTTQGRRNDVDLSCGADGRDQIYRLFVTQPLVSLTVDTLGSDINTALAIRGGTCDGTTDLQCAVNNFGNMDSRVTINTVAIGEYFLIVDDQSTSSPTSYNLNVSGTLAAGGACNPSSTSFICTAGYTCGASSTCVPTVCNDMVDADGDGKNGYPTDPGCVDISDTSETDSCPSGADCPVCANGIDDDGDSRTDYPNDLGCTAASGGTELECTGETDPLAPITGAVTTGTTVGAANNFNPSCQTNDAGDRAFILTLPVAVASLTLDTEGSTGLTDSILIFTDSTCGTQIECDDDDGTGNLSTITRTNVAAGTYGIVVDTYSSSSSGGAFTLNVRGTVATGTACTSPLFASGVLACPSGTTCNGSVCQ